MKRGQLLLVDNRPAEFLEYESDERGDYITYRHLGELMEHSLSMGAFAIRAHVPMWRS